MKMLVGRKTLPIVSLGAVLALGAVGCDENGDDTDSIDSPAGKAGSGGTGKGGKGGSSSESDSGGKGGSNSEAGRGGAGGSGGSSPDAGSGGTGGSEAPLKHACDPTQADMVNVDKNIEADTTWECGTYLLQNMVYVTKNATLTIKPGVVVIGDTDTKGRVKALVITRGAKLEAVGTKEDPIVFTSGNGEGSRLPGDWGGVVLLGRASVNKGNCVEGTGDACSGGYLQGNIEGLNPDDPNALYGGKDDKHNCGHLEYVRIEYAGYQLSPDNELNGLTVGACGTDTKLTHIQIHRGSDDAIEFFGGTAGIDHALFTGMSDDGLDWDLGWRGKAQFIVIHQAGNDGDKGIEADNQGENEVAEPRSNPELWNFTMIGNPAKTAMLLREGTRGKLRNFIVQNFAIGVDIAAKLAKPAQEWPGELSIEDSLFFNVKDAGDPDMDDDDMGFKEDEALKASDRKNKFDVDPKLGSTDITKPDYKPGNKDVGGKATPPSGFDAKGTYAGAFDPEGDDWSKGWTNYSKE